MPAIHQLVAGYAKGDAISNESRVLRQMFRDWGHESEIYCEQRRTLPELRKDARDLAEAATTIRADDIVVLHLSIGSPANAVFKTLPGRKVIVYHNVTPPEFFVGLQEEIAHHLRTGREQVASLAGAAEINLADSKFNASELEALGYENVHVMPLKLERGQWEGSLDRRIVQQFGDGRTNILFVGRGAPNKRIEDLLFTHYYVQRYVDPDARLIHVGSYSGLERYEALLRAKAADIKLQNYVLTGSVPPEVLRSYYSVATVFLCMSEHEGFCIPLLEAMAHRVPVLAYAAGAVPETMADAGILLREKRFDLAAELIGRIASDTPLRETLIANQATRLQRYLDQDIPTLWKTHLGGLLGK
ncbi:MAG: glycosyltransferase family 4 protein [Kiritimatiellae bacterium]|nr:glycosyltransferase family 4 protein [Kiritimatiellia bacterium]